FLGISKSITVWDGVKMQDDNGAAIMILVMALLGALFAFLANKKHLASIGTLIMFALITLIAFVWHGDIPEMASAGFGLYLMMIAGLLGIVSSVLGFMKK
ncbi:MAG: hypothetical protein ACKO6L_11445, partial [Flavobacteriales bacterium]